MGLADHCVLRGVAQEHDEQEVAHPDRARAAAEQEAEDREQKPEHQRAAHDEFHRRHAEAEDLGPVQSHGIPMRPAVWAFLVQS